VGSQFGNANAAAFDVGNFTAMFNDDASPPKITNILPRTFITRWPHGNSSTESGKLNANARSTARAPRAGGGGGYFLLTTVSC
jgi:hypothetical protein